jgi:hypothetical protein
LYGWNTVLSQIASALLTILGMIAIVEDHDGRDSWRRDIENRQRSIVFPDTVRNEARLWRNLVEDRTPWKKSTKVGVAILAVFVGSWLAVLTIATHQQGVTWILALLMLLVWGPIFAILRWATKRTLKNIEEQKRHGSRTPKH